MSRSDPGWAWFEAAPGGGEAADLDLAAAFARCFRGEDGGRVIGHLRAITLGRAFGPAASDAQLRHAEGQRQLVAYVNALIERGRQEGHPR
ncbi:MAG: hypothetical protein RBS99_14870 [Rhodospirillales bacterium]|jgi:hypothetical protein|nr:hypothetical protein [Rhodospirillales bacterium]